MTRRPGGLLRAVPLLAALALLATVLGGCERAAGGGGQSGPYIGVGGGVNRLTR